MCTSKCQAFFRRLVVWAPVILLAYGCDITEPEDQSHLRIWNFTEHWTLTPEVDHVRREPVLPGETGRYIVRAREHLTLVMVNAQNGLLSDTVVVIFPRRPYETRSHIDGSPRYSPLIPVYNLIVEDAEGTDGVVLRWNIRNDLD